MKNLNKEISAVLKDIQGWCSEDKASKIASLIINEKPKLCVEIGVFGGASLIPQAMALKFNKKGIIYGIDPWANTSALEEMVDEKHKEWWNKIDLEYIYEHCKKNVSDNKLNDYCVLIRDKSENVVNQFQDNSIDLLHIDGNHSEAVSYTDSTLYLPKVKSGGIILFDDIWWTENDMPTTRKAVVFLLESCDKIDIIADCIVLKKK